MTTHEKNTSTPGERAQALLQVLKQKDLIPDGYIEHMTQLMAHEWTPENGARVVAKAWVDPQFRELLLKDGTAACAQFGYTGPQGEYIVALEDTPSVKNVIVCSLCSCTNWPVLGLPPEWYKGFEFRARLVREGRTVLRELGTELPDEVTIKVWDTSAESRYLVLPLRPKGSEAMDEEALRKLITKDVLIGVALPYVA
ncbi:nitrile hydratase [Pseudomonas chlororaphis]|uniref:nitrile hydratase n=1 Tax=Pseudomonas chlororaphis subsp. aurantiaca TaxID=86192 RepID=A0AAJ0ZFE6_9PSED|nr:nitrile hydratase subunit alpha [Pseudomonas chlororaphis]AZD48801.1 Cobalt-containing nitrile hydratase subunit alpha [Pseudomonas chlororaphis subsp. aurantiaca]AZD67233.1 Cobalt-containing nitrile hydratase subunit alpha [Pseudomonas chlororaphis subsp. aurantiaca]MBU4631389.1 nitrile hydratase subunit alpha [Pseudomonas chlororaphis subsp. aurantiaca]QIT23230.1 nitrile hydratase subunit alpha [Pseudomonas chlororaphis subsp. aurantiaca]QQX56207.1 nitrile hydratase subunit alpha [Pseudom